MTPSAEAVAKIIAVVPPDDWSSKTDVQILTDVQAMTVSNPESQTNTLPTMTATNILGLLSTSLAKLASVPTIVAVRDDIRAQDREGVLNWAALYLAAGLITSAEYEAVLAFVNTPVADPNYSAVVSWAKVNLGREIQLEDIQAARLGVG